MGFFYCFFLCQSINGLILKNLFALLKIRVSLYWYTWLGSMCSICPKKFHSFWKLYIMKYAHEKRDYSEEYEIRYFWKNKCKIRNKKNPQKTQLFLSTHLEFFLWGKEITFIICSCLYFLVTWRFFVSYSPIDYF